MRITLGWLVLYERKRTPIPPLRFSVALSGIHLFGVIHAYITLGITGGVYVGLRDRDGTRD